MFTYAFEALKNHLAATVSELREIDWYLQQDSTSDKNTWIYAAPVVYLEFTPIGEIRTHGGGKIQSVNASVTAHLITENVFDNSKRIKKDQPSDHLRISDKVFKNLQGFSAKLSVLDEFAALANTPNDQRLFNSLNRSGYLPPHRIRKAMMKSTHTLTAMFYDHAARKTYQPVNPNLDINPQLETFG